MTPLSVIAVHSTPPTQDVVRHSADETLDVTTLMWDWDNRSVEASENSESVEVWAEASRHVSTHMALWQALLSDLVHESVGLLAAEVWICDPSGASLTRPEGGFYIDPVCQPSDAAALAALEALAAQPKAAAPVSFGLVGVLWERASRAPRDEIDCISLFDLWKFDDSLLHDRRTERSALCFDHCAAIRFKAGGMLAGGGGGVTTSHPACMLVVYGRKVECIRHPSNLAFFWAAAGAIVGLAATSAARARLHAAKGARATAWRKLRSAASSGDLARGLRRIAAARAAISSTKKRRFSDPLVIAQMAASTAVAARGARPSRAYPTDSSKRPLLLSRLGCWLLAYVVKWRGVRGAQPKPVHWCEREQWEACAWAWCGSVVTLLVLATLSEYVVDLSEGDYFLLLGSAGALMAILFGAPHSAFAQPRAVIGSNMVAASIAVTCHYLSSPLHLGLLPKRATIALAPATAIAVNHRLGLLHPPAGAAALIFVSGGDEITLMGWYYLLIPLLVANVVSLFFAALINNLSAKRQFPLYWLGKRMGAGTCVCDRRGKREGTWV